MKPEERNAQFYSDLFTGKEHDYYKMHKKRIERVLSFLKGGKGEKLLDIGCGDGFISALLAKTISAKPYGIDISHAAVEKARERGVEARVYDIGTGTLPFEKEYFDVVFCGEVIEHIYDTEKLLRSVFHVLKPGGMMIATVPNTGSWYNRGFLLIGWLPTWIESSATIYTGNPFMKDSVGHIRAFTKRSLKELLEVVGFEEITIKGSPFLGNGTFSKNKEKIWDIIDKKKKKKAGLASSLVVKCKKPNK